MMPRKSDEEVLAATLLKAEEIKARIANRSQTEDEKDLTIMAKQDEIIAKANERKDAAALRISERANTQPADASQMTFDSAAVDEV